MPRKTSTPKYCRRTDCGKNYAVVTPANSRTGERRTNRLGVYDTPARRERYLRLLTEGERNGRRLSDEPDPDPSDGSTVTQLCNAFWRSLGGADDNPIGVDSTSVVVTIIQPPPSLGALGRMRYPQ